MNYKKILGCLLGAATGDAMGAATETKSTNQIKEIYNGRVEDFKKPCDDVLARGRNLGQITDSFSIAYMLIDEIIKEKFIVSKKLGEKVLIKWGKTEWFEPFAGMTTRKVVNRLMNNNNMSSWEYAGHLGNQLYKGHYYALSSNGASTKAFPLGLINPNNLEKTIEDTIEITMSSHDDPYSISGACAVSCAISEAMNKNTSVYNIVQAGLYGAKTGEELARKRKDIWVYPGPSVLKRMEMAIELALHQSHSNDAMSELRDCIGCGPAISETVPTAFGLFIANKGNTMKSIYDATNIGDETSAIATITGALGGTFNGSDSIMSDYLNLIEDKNQINIQYQASKILNHINHINKI